MSIRYGNISDTPEAKAKKLLAPKRRGPNRFRTANAAETIAEMNCNPLRELLMIARRRKTPLDLRIQCYAHCLKFCFPALSTQHITALTESHVYAKNMTMALDKAPHLAAALEELSLMLTMGPANDNQPPTIIEITPELPGPTPHQHPDPPATEPEP